jgi:hypothetical protein
MERRPTGRFRQRIARWGVRVVGFVIGLVGLLLVGLAISLAWNAVQERAYPYLGRAFLTAAFAIYPLWVGSNAIRGFSLRLTKHVSAIAALTVCGILEAPLERAVEYFTFDLYDLGNISAELVFIASEIAVFFLAYRGFPRVGRGGVAPEYDDTLESQNGRAGDAAS